MPCWRARPTEAVVSLAQIIILYTQKQGRSDSRERRVGQPPSTASGSRERRVSAGRNDLKGPAARQPRAPGRMPRLPG
jgi:hypothetical protein